MAIPALHISLGFFLKLFNLLEEAAHQVDVLWAATTDLTDSQQHYTQEFLDYRANLQAANKLYEEASQEEEAATTIEQMAPWLALTLQHEEAAMRQLEELQSRAKQHRESAKLKVYLQLLCSDSAVF